MRFSISIFFVFIFTFIKSQTWCPQGATWHYRVYVPIFYPYQDGTIKLTYTHTTNINNITCKHLTGEFKGIIGTASSPTQTANNYVDIDTYENNNIVYLYNSNTLIFDTIANLNALIGDKWLLAEFPSPSAPSCNFNRPIVSVIDTGHAIVNSHWLKKIVVNYTLNSMAKTDTIIERILDVRNFLFPYYHCIADGPNYGGFVCYQDNNFGTFIRPGYTLCNYIPVNINEHNLFENKIFIYPNPVKDKLNLNFNSSREFDKVSIYNSISQLIREEEIAFKNNSGSIKIADLPNGVYYLNLNGINKRFVIAK